MSQQQQQSLFDISGQSAEPQVSSKKTTSPEKKPPAPAAAATVHPFVSRDNRSCDICQKPFSPFHKKRFDVETKVYL